MALRRVLGVSMRYGLGAPSIIAQHGLMRRVGAVGVRRGLDVYVGRGVAVGVRRGVQLGWEADGAPVGNVGAMVGNEVGATVGGTVCLN